MTNKDLHVIWDEVIEELRKSLNLSDLKLNERETDALENAPESLLRIIEDEFGKIVFENHPYNFRNQIALKAIAHLLVNKKRIQRIIEQSYDNAENIT